MQLVTVRVSCSYCERLSERVREHIDPPWPTLTAPAKKKRNLGKILFQRLICAIHTLQHVAHTRPLVKLVTHTRDCCKLLIMAYPIEYKTASTLNVPYFRTRDCNPLGCLQYSPVLSRFTTCRAGPRFHLRCSKHQGAATT